jgi:hypothetical protein
LLERLVDRHIVAVGLLTEQDLSLLGTTFTRLWPVDSAPKFDELLAAIDEAEREHQNSAEQLMSDQQLRD